MSTVREIIQSDLASHFLGKKIATSSDHGAMLVMKVKVLGDPFRVELTGEAPDKKSELKLESHVKRPAAKKHRRNDLLAVILAALCVLAVVAAYNMGYEAGNHDGRNSLAQEVGNK